MSFPLVRSEARGVDTSASRQYLVFVASGVEMGVALDRVSEILPYEKVTEVPGTPPYIRGVVQVRGRVVPVVDLSVRLGRAAQVCGKRTCIVMLDLGEHGRTLPMGIVVDEVATLLDAELGKVSPPPNFGGGAEVAFLEGMYPGARGMLPLVDVGKLFVAGELSDLSQLSQAPGKSP